MNKKLLLALWIYATWVAAALVYSKKSPEQIKQELQSANSAWEWGAKVLFNNFIEVHQNLLESLKTRLLTEENKQLFFQKRDEVISKIWEFRETSEQLFEEYKVLWKDKSWELLEKLEKFYEAKLDELEEIKKKTPEKIEEVKNKISEYFEELKAKIKK